MRMKSQIFLNHACPKDGYFIFYGLYCNVSKKKKKTITELQLTAAHCGGVTRCVDSVGEFQSPLQKK